MYRKDALREPAHPFSPRQREFRLLKELPELRVGSYEASVTLIRKESALRIGDALLEDKTPPRDQGGRAPLQNAHRLEIVEIANHPLDPDYGIGAALWGCPALEWRLVGGAEARRGEGLTRSREEAPNWLEKLHLFEMDVC